MVKDKENPDWLTDRGSISTKEFQEKFRLIKESCAPDGDVAVPLPEGWEKEESLVNFINAISGLYDEE